MCKRLNNMRHLITYLTLVLLLSACYDAVEDSVTTREEREIPETTIEGALTGRAYNNDGSVLTDYLSLIHI